MFHNHDIIRRFLDLLKKLHFPVILVSYLFNLHHKHIIKKLEYIFKLTFKTYNNVSRDTKTIRSKGVIWMLWWQGYVNMPDVVYKCIKSTKMHGHNHKIILITKDNVKKYAKLPSYIYTKLDNGEISFTNFSDILEFNLLRHYGGLWTDATVYWNDAIPSKCFNYLYTASGGYPKYRDNISLGRWTGFLFGGNANEPLFIFMDYFFQIYWKYNNYLIDYFIIDYALNFAYEHNIGEFRTYLNKNVVAKPNIYKMAKYLNKPYNSNIYDKLIKNTPLFKLTYKKRINKHKSNTFYHYLMNKD